VIGVNGFGERRVSFRRLITILTFLAILTMAVRVAVDTDTWWHLKAGEWMSEKGAVLRTDPFSSTRFGENWVYPGWLAQIMLYQVYRVGGYGALNMLTGFLVLLAFALIWPRLDAPPLVRAFVLILGAAASGVYWAARPHIFSFVLAGGFLAILEGFEERDRRWMLMLPVLMAVWANIHGGFAIGFLILFSYVGGAILELLAEAISGQGLRAAVKGKAGDLRWLLLITLACAAAVALNPNGPVLLLYPFKTVSIGVLQQYIQEWQSPDFHRAEVLPFLVMMLALLTALTTTTRKVQPAEYLLAAGFLLLALLSGRNIALFALAGTIPLARHGYGGLLRLKPLFPERKDLSERVTRPLNALLVVLFLIAAILKIRIPLQQDVIQDAFEESLPVGAVDYLEEHPGLGTLFNSYNWGGYVIWRLHPDYLSFVDGRTDLFGDVILNDYVMAWRADEGWEQVLEAYDVDVALLESDAPLSRALAHAGWQAAYEDEDAAILIRPDS